MALVGTHRITACSKSEVRFQILHQSFSTCVALVDLLFDLGGTKRAFLHGTALLIRTLNLWKVGRQGGRVFSVYNCILFSKSFGTEFQVRYDVTVRDKKPPLIPAVRKVS